MNTVPPSTAEWAGLLRLAIAAAGGPVVFPLEAPPAQVEDVPSEVALLRRLVKEQAFTISALRRDLHEIGRRAAAALSGS